MTADTDFEAQVRAIRDSAYEDKTLTVRVIAEAAPPPPLNPPTFKPATHYEVNERAPLTPPSFLRGIHVLHSERGLPYGIG